MSLAQKSRRRQKKGMSTVAENRVRQSEHWMWYVMHVMVGLAKVENRSIFLDTFFIQFPPLHPNKVEAEGGWLLT